MSYRLEFFEATLPPTVNTMGRWHWTRKVKLAQMWQRIIGMHVAGSIPRRPLARARITLTWRGSRELDYDNLVSAFKIPIDCLRKAGILRDDNIQHIGVPQYKQEKVKRKDVGIHILVEGGE
jgi:Holliday junction resolvase RusA-like endonuclease